MYKAGRNILAIALILLGLGLLAWPTIVARYDEHRERQLLEAWQASLVLLDAEDIPLEEAPPETDEDDSAAQDQAAAQAQAQAEAEKAAQAAEAARQAYIQEHMTGTLTIEAIDLYQPVLRETTDKNLRMALTVVQPSAAPGSAGNLVIAGHNNYGYGRHFNRLSEVAEGQAVTITTADGTYTYTVTASMIVEPDDTSVLLGERDQSTITLITCYPQRNPDKRLIVKGILTP